MADIQVQAHQEPLRSPKDQAVGRVWSKGLGFGVNNGFTFRGDFHFGEEGGDQSRPSPFAKVFRSFREYPK